MELKKITVRLECTINLGNYENMKPSVVVEGQAEEGDTAENIAQQTGELFETARQELGLSLWEMAEGDLKQMNFGHYAEDDREAAAERNSPEFRWMLKLHPMAARDMLADILETQAEQIAAGDEERVKEKQEREERDRKYREEREERERKRAEAEAQRDADSGGNDIAGDGADDEDKYPYLDGDDEADDEPDDSADDADEDNDDEQPVHGDADTDVKEAETETEETA